MLIYLGGVFVLRLFSVLYHWIDFGVGERRLPGGKKGTFHKSVSKASKQETTKAGSHSASVTIEVVSLTTFVSGVGIEGVHVVSDAATVAREVVGV